MLRELLVHNIEHYEDEVKKYILSHRSKEITGTIFYTHQEYENYMQIYRTTKSQYNNVLEAFVSLWVSALIDAEEWHDNFEFNVDYADGVYNNWFKKEVSCYTFNNVTTESLREYVIYKALRMKELVVKYQNNNPLKQCNITYPSSIPGIYRDRYMIDEQRYELIIPKNLVAAEELYYYNNWAGYKDIFIETEQEYIYFSE